MTDATLFDLSARDRLRIEGPDAASFLNRLVTIDVKNMAVGSGALTFLLEPKGRIQACFHLLRISRESFLAECSPGHGAEVCARLDVYLFGEQISFTPCEDLTVLSLQGRGARAMLVAAGIKPPEAPWEHLQTELGRVARIDRAGPGFDIWCSDSAALQETLQTRAEGLRALETMRIEAGFPDHPAEYGPHSNPLEVSDRTGITEGKGCYPGQEVIERTLALGRPPRKLVRLVLEGEVVAGVAVLDGDKTVGVVTSVAGRAALALVKRKLETSDGLLCEGGVAVRFHA